MKINGLSVQDYIVQPTDCAITFVGQTSEDILDMDITKLVVTTDRDEFVEAVEGYSIRNTLTQILSVDGMFILTLLRVSDEVLALQHIIELKDQEICSLGERIGSLQTELLASETKLLSAEEHLRKVDKDGLSKYSDD